MIEQENHIKTENLIKLWELGFKLVPLNENNREIEPWTPIYNDETYWTPERLRKESHKFRNVATVFGKTHLKDEQGRDLYLNCLDIDSDNVYNILFNLENGNNNHRFSLIPKCQQVTFVTKTRKKNGFHVYWLSHIQNRSISVEHCKKGYEFEIKTDKRRGHCTLPNSTHKEDTNFCYKNYGQNKIGVSDEFYDELLKLLKDCLESKEEDIQEKISNNDASRLIYESNYGIKFNLTDEEILQICKWLRPYYKKGCNCRNGIVFGLSGLCHKCNIAEDSAYKLIDALAKDDEERNARLCVIEETYRKHPKEVSGRKKFLAALIHATGENYVAKDVFQKIFEIILSKLAVGDKSRINYVIVLTNELIKENTFKTMKDTQEIYYYNEDKGVFSKGGEWKIQEDAELLYPQVCTNQVNEVINHIRRKTLTGREEFDSQIEWLACKNCMVNPRTMETRLHSPSFMATIQVPWNFEPRSTIGRFYGLIEGTSSPIDSPQLLRCPKIMKFMHQVMSDEDVETVLDFIAYCLWRGIPFHKTLLFVGSGRNGKGVMTEIIRRLLGIRNVSGESLQQILTNRFVTVRLYGKLANIDADLSKETLRDTGVLKKLTGGDLIRAEEKFKSPFDFVNYAKLIFAANQLPNTEDQTPAFFSRLIIIHFPDQFVGEKADPFLIDKLCTEEELTGLLSLVIERLPSVLKDGIQIKNESIAETYKNYILASDSAEAFVEEFVEQNEGNKIPKIRVYQEYTTFCKGKKVTPESEQSFSRKMTSYGFKSKQFPDRAGGGKPYYWIDIALKELDKRENFVTTEVA